MQLEPDLSRQRLAQLRQFLADMAVGVLGRQKLGPVMARVENAHQPIEKLHHDPPGRQTRRRTAGITGLLGCQPDHPQPLGHVLKPRGRRQLRLIVHG